MTFPKVSPQTLEKQTAVVIGGSIARLLSARVLADYFESVAIVETDKLPEKPEARKGVPQSVQPHVLFTRGYRILEELFPGIGTELSTAGALSIDWTREFHHFGEGGWSQSAEENPLRLFPSPALALYWNGQFDDDWQVFNRCSLSNNIVLLGCFQTLVKRILQGYACTHWLVTA